MNKKNIKEKGIITAADFQKAFGKSGSNLSLDGSTNRQLELIEQMEVCKFLQRNVDLFMSDLAGFAMRSGAIAYQMRKQDKFQKAEPFPDLYIFDAVGDYNGLVIELKYSHRDIRTVKGKLLRKQHVQRQASMLRRFQSKGYAAGFGCGAEETIKGIQAYLKGECFKKYIYI